MTASLLGLALVLGAAASQAAPTEGEKLFREGRAAMQQNDYETACARFAESQKKEPAPGTQLNLGECEERRNHLIAARDAFASAASTYTAADKKGYATGRAEALDKRIPKIVVKVTGAKSPVVKIGERTIDVGAEQRLDPGETVFTIEAPSFKPKRMPVTLKEGSTLVEVELGPLESENAPVAVQPKKVAPPVAPPREEPANGLRTVGFVVAGVGAASLIVGGVTGVMTLGRASTVKDHCDGDLACDPDGTSAARQGKTLSLISTITIIAGAAGVGAGVALVLTSPAQKTGIVSGPGDVGLALRRTF